MLSRGLKISFGIGILLIVLTVVLYEVLRYYNAPADAEFELVTVFAATFASSILTFFVGALLFDYQVERTESKRNRQLRTLLDAELYEISEALDRANAMPVRLSNDSTAEVVITHVQPTVIEGAVRDGFFDPPEKALRLARNMYSYNARVSYLLSILSSGKTDDEPGQLLPHVIQEIEDTRQTIVADARLLSAPRESGGM